MDFPIEPFEPTIKTAVEIAKWLVNEYQKYRESRQSNERDDCCLKTLYALRQESERKKLEYIKCFAQNAILSETCNIDTEGILRFLKDIEQMTWRQFCFIEGVKRKSHNQINIIGMDTSDVNGKLRLSEMEELVNLNYLAPVRDGKFHFNGSLLRTDDIGIKLMGFQLSMLMEFELIPIDEIAKAFGAGMIK